MRRGRNRARYRSGTVYPSLGIQSTGRKARFYTGSVKMCLPPSGHFVFNVSRAQSCCPGQEASGVHAPSSSPGKAHPLKRKGVWGVARLRAGLEALRGRCFVGFLLAPPPPPPPPSTPAASTSQEFSLRSPRAIYSHHAGRKLGLRVPGGSWWARGTFWVPGKF